MNNPLINRLWSHPWGRRIVLSALVGAFGAAAVHWIYPELLTSYIGVVNAPLTYDIGEPLSEREFARLAAELTQTYRQERALAQTASEENAFARRLKVDILMRTRSFQKEAPYPHIEYFRKAGIRRYEGPKTCLTCHATIKVTDGQGKVSQVNTLEDVVHSVHFKFQSTSSGFSTYGFDGREVNGKGTQPIPVGKIDRACGVPGSFTWTGWAELVKSKPAHGNGEIEVRSEGCGQCHIGGGYHPSTEQMLPGHDAPAVAKEGIDCLICHATGYDMNQRTVIEDKHGRRWNQDRSLKTALTVGQPTAQTCLFCHQHNMGGDREENLPPGSAPDNLGHKNRRLLHPGAKRGNSFQKAFDVHAAAGMVCTDCHQPEGHKIPRGDKGVDLVANDLPHKKVECESCHTAAPHVKDTQDRALLNGHVDRLSCEACHIKELRADNVVLRDWVHPVWDAEEGVYVFKDVYQSGKPGKGFKFLWFNGNGTFLANALGDNPVVKGRYNPLMNQLVRIDDPEAVAQIRAAALELQKNYPDLDVERYVKEATNPLLALSPEMLAKRQKMIEENIRPVMEQGKSRLYPFKVFNAIMYEEMGNQGPFGAMILPFDYPVYYETGKPEQSVKKALQHPIVKRMYEAPFKAYMMDEFMRYFGVGRWSGVYPLTADGQLKNVEAHWMRQMGSLMVNHGIRKEGRRCKECHSTRGIIDFEGLGYPPERVAELQSLPEMK
ncbi:MAG: nitrite reductase [Magnetococcales bacterium]|nr:nitrite reductase [Magnetococcales bacterium]